MYGPTEASVDCVHTHVTDVSLTDDIGRPLPDNRLYILNENLCPTHISIEGELSVGGVQLTHGYLNAVVAFVEFKPSVTEDQLVDKKEALKLYISVGPLPTVFSVMESWDEV